MGKLENIIKGKTPATVTREKNRATFTGINGTGLVAEEQVFLPCGLAPGMGWTPYRAHILPDSNLPALLEAKSISINALLDIAPEGTPNPTIHLYDSSM